MREIIKESANESELSVLELSAALLYQKQLKQPLQPKEDPKPRRDSRERNDRGDRNNRGERNNLEMRVVIIVVIVKTDHVRLKLPVMISIGKPTV